MGAIRIPFDVVACRQWLELYPDPPKDELPMLWGHLLDDIEAACDEIEWLRAERQAVVT